MREGADERPLARSVVARGRFARIFSLGDRAAPSSWTPGLVVYSDDPEKNPHAVLYRDLTFQQVQV